MTATLILTSAACLGACRSPEPQSPAPELTSGVETPRAHDLGRGAPRVAVEGAYNIYVSEPVRRACSGSVPFFELDSSDTRAIDEPTMRSLADCMLSGPLRGKTIKLVGRTDPRGSAGYNEKLGLERAERVKGVLVKRGIDAGRVEVESAGEAGASAAPTDWAIDRRVDVRLVP